MGIGIAGHVRDTCAHVGYCLLHGRDDGGEGGCEVIEYLGERVARVAYGKGDELHSSPVFLDGRDAGRVFLWFFRDFVVVAEVST